MKQINPLYIALLLVVILVMVMVRLDHTKQQQYTAADELKETTALAERIVALKKNWDDAKRSEQSLARIMNASQLRDAQIVQKKNPGSVLLSSDGLDAVTLNYLMNKLLNGSFALKSVKIRQLEGERYALNVEVAL